MLRFGSKSPAKSGRPFRELWRIWMLVFALGVVIFAMRKLNQPETIEKLDRLMPRPTAAGTPAVAAKSGVAAADVEVSAIEDNTYFRPEERETWFELFARLQNRDSAGLAAASVGELTYAQLLQQPDVYRGRIVTLHGTVLREEEQKPEENSLGITGYHRLWLKPRGGGDWPFVVYALSLPDDFPRGDELRAEASVTGYFFKNWSYKYDDGLGLAPVVLAGGVDWQRPPAVAPRPEATVQDFILPVTGFALIALVSVWFAVRNSMRRPRQNDLLPDNLTLPADWSKETRSGGQS